MGSIERAFARTNVRSIKCSNGTDNEIRGGIDCRVDHVIDSEFDSEVGSVINCGIEREIDSHIDWHR